MNLTGLVALVTGGASGLGRATAALLAARGALVTILDIDSARGEAAALATGCHFRALDVTCETAIDAALAACEASRGPARLLVNCAGVAPNLPLVDAGGGPHLAGVYESCLRVNLLGTLLLTSRFAARLARCEPLGEERGLVINTASIAAYDGQANMTAYAAAKAGVAGLTLPAARELAPLGIRVMAIAPGMFHTPMIGMSADEAQKRLGSQNPFPNRLGQPEEFAMLVADIVRNPMLNGSVIRLDAAHRLPG